VAQTPTNLRFRAKDLRGIGTLVFLYIGLRSKVTLSVMAH